MMIREIIPIHSLESLDPEDDNLDIAVNLDNGQTYVFTVATPKNAYRWMINDNVTYYVGDPVVLVKRLSPDCIAQALAAIISDDSGTSLRTYGTLEDDLGLEDGAGSA
jgi:hypothetical protein